MKAIVCGTRGSFPRSSDHYKKYGLNTSCFYIECTIHLFLDAGTGIIEGSDYIKDKEDVHILLSHLHIDHIVLDKKDALCGIIYRTIRCVRLVFPGSLDIFFVRELKLQPDDHLGSVSGSGKHLDRTSHKVDYALGYRKAEARALYPADRGRSFSFKCVEHLLGEFLRHAYAAVLNAHFIGAVTVFAGPDLP